MLQGCALVLCVLVCESSAQLFEVGSFFVIPILLMKKLRPGAMRRVILEEAPGGWS